MKRFFDRANAIAYAMTLSSGADVRLAKRHSNRSPEGAWRVTPRTDGRVWCSSVVGIAHAIPTRYGAGWLR